MSMVLQLSASLFLLASCVLSLHAAAGQGGATAVSGTVAVNKTTIALKHGRAYGFDSVTAAGKNIALLLADRPIDEVPLREQLKIFGGARVVPGAFTGAWAGMFLEKKLQGIAFTWGADKRLMLNDIYADGQDSQFGLPDDSFVVTLKELSEKRVSGTMTTVKPRLEVGSDGLAITVDVTFDVPVGPLPK
jgi:hypothetical protein